MARSWPEIYISPKNKGAANTRPSIHDPGTIGQKSINATLILARRLRRHELRGSDHQLTAIFLLPSARAMPTTTTSMRRAFQKSKPKSSKPSFFQKGENIPCRSKQLPHRKKKGRDLRLEHCLEGKPPIKCTSALTLYGGIPSHSRSSSPLIIKYQGVVPL